MASNRLPLGQVPPHSYSVHGNVSSQGARQPLSALATAYGPGEMTGAVAGHVSNGVPSADDDDHHHLQARDAVGPMSSPAQTPPVQAKLDQPTRPRMMQQPSITVATANGSMTNLHTPSHPDDRALASNGDDLFVSSPLSTTGPSPPSPPLSPPVPAESSSSVESSASLSSNVGLAGSTLTSIAASAASAASPLSTFISTYLPTSSSSSPTPVVRPLLSSSSSTPVLSNRTSTPVLGSFFSRGSSYMSTATSASSSSGATTTTTLSSTTFTAAAATSPDSSSALAATTTTTTTTTSGSSGTTSTTTSLASLIRSTSALAFTAVTGGASGGAGEIEESTDPSMDSFADSTTTGAEPVLSSTMSSQSHDHGSFASSFGAVSSFPPTFTTTQTPTHGGQGYYDRPSTSDETATLSSSSNRGSQDSDQTDEYASLSESNICFVYANEKRFSDFHSLFRSVPDDEKLIEDYGCALQKEILVQGRLYISENHVCFNANIFGWVTNLVIHFSEIMAIDKRMTAFVIPNAIGIVTTANPRGHFFASFLSRDAAYDLLMAAWRKSYPCAANANYQSPQYGANNGSSGSIAISNNGSHSNSAYLARQSRSLDGVSFMDDDDVQSVGPSSSESRRNRHRRSFSNASQNWTGDGDDADEQSLHSQQAIAGSDEPGAKSGATVRRRGSKRAVVRKLLKGNLSPPTNSGNNTNNNNSNNESSKRTGRPRSVSELPPRPTSFDGAGNNHARAVSTAVTSGTRGETDSMQSSLDQEPLAPYSTAAMLGLHQRARAGTESLPNPRTNGGIGGGSQTLMIPNPRGGVLTSMVAAATATTAATVFVGGARGGLGYTAMATPPASPGVPPVSASSSPSTPTHSAAVISAKSDATSPGSRPSTPTGITRKATTCKCSKDGRHYSNQYMNETYPGTVQAMWKLLFDSEFNKAFLTSEVMKGADVQEEAWKPCADPTGTTTKMTRYIKWLGMPIGPKTTKAILNDVCEYKDFDQYVSTVTTTSTPDVPSGGCFTAKCRTCISWAGPSHVRITVTGCVEFTKSSWIKGQIEKGAQEGMGAHYRFLNQAIRKHIAAHPNEFSAGPGGAVVASPQGSNRPVASLAAAVGPSQGGQNGDMRARASAGRQSGKEEDPRTTATGVPTSAMASSTRAKGSSKDYQQSASSLASGIAEWLMSFGTSTSPGQRSPRVRIQVNDSNSQPAESATISLSVWLLVLIFATAILVNLSAVWQMSATTARLERIQSETLGGGGGLVKPTPSRSGDLEQDSDVGVRFDAYDFLFDKDEDDHLDRDEELEELERILVRVQQKRMRTKSTDEASKSEVTESKEEGSETEFEAVGAEKEESVTDKADEDLLLSRHQLKQRQTRRRQDRRRRFKEAMLRQQEEEMRWEKEQEEAMWVWLKWRDRRHLQFRRESGIDFDTQARSSTKSNKGSTKEQEQEQGQETESSLETRMKRLEEQIAALERHASALVAETRRVDREEL